MENGKWENWVNLFAGLWIFIIPWSFGQYMTSTAMSGVMWNFWFVGGIVFASSALALNKIQVWEEWTNFVAGIWLLISPWMLGYSGYSVLLSNAMVLGLTIALVSGLAIPVARKMEKQAY